MFNPPYSKMSTIITVIKALRKFRKYTQEDMADKLHLSLRAYQKIESGDTRLDIDRLKKIADILGVSMIDLINAKNKTERLLPAIQRTSRNKDPIKIQHASLLIKRVLNILIESKEREVIYLQEIAEQEDSK